MCSGIQAVWCSQTTLLLVGSRLWQLWPQLQATARVTLLNSWHLLHLHVDSMFANQPATYCADKLKTSLSAAHDLPGIAFSCPSHHAAGIFLLHNAQAFLLHTTIFSVHCCSLCCVPKSCPVCVVRACLHGRFHLSSLNLLIKTSKIKKTTDSRHLSKGLQSCEGKLG